MQKGYYKLDENKNYVRLISISEIIEAFNSKILYEYDGHFVRNVDYLDTYSLIEG